MITDTSPAGLLAATTRGELYWTNLRPGTYGLGELVLELREKIYALTGGGAPLEQKNGFFGRCALAKLHDAAAASARVPDWAPTTGELKPLGEPITEPRWRQQLATAKLVERARFRDHAIVAVEIGRGGGGITSYAFRVFVTPPGGAAPVLAVNHETGIAGAFYGAHRGAVHVNYDAAPPSPSYEEFKRKAMQILADELLAAAPAAPARDPIADAWARGEVAMSANAAGQLRALGVAGVDAPTCAHKELFESCRSAGLLVCGGCGRAACGEPYHIFCRFMTVRGGTMHDTSGSKLHYYCNGCRSHVCIFCLGIEDDYPCDPAALETHPFACPKCDGPVRVLRIDGVDYAGAAPRLLELPSAALKPPGMPRG